MICRDEGMVSEKTPQVAVIGAGYWGKNLVLNFDQFAITALRWVCDSDAETLQRIKKEFQFDVILEVGTLLADALRGRHCHCRSGRTAFELAKQALMGGKHVFVEKPLSLHVEHAEELTQLARKAGRVLMVGHLLQYHPAIQKLKSLIREGALGKVQYIYSSRLNLGKLRTEENILWSFAPHDISAILFLLGEEPTSVAAHGGNYLNANVADVTLTSCNFASGVTAHIFVSWLHPFKEQKLVVVGDRQMAVFDDMQTERKLVLYPHRIEWLDRHPIAKRSEGRVIPLPPLEPLRLECLHFLECISDASKSQHRREQWRSRPADLEPRVSCP